MVKILRMKFGHDFELNFCSILLGWDIVEILKLKFAQDFGLRLKFSLDFEAVKTLKLNFVKLVT